MWHVYYLHARQMAEEREQEAARERLARGATRRPTSSRSWLGSVRRGGAIVAAGIARRLDECVAREELNRRADDRVGATN